MGKKNKKIKKVKKVKKLKSLIERSEEVIKIKSKLKLFGLSEEHIGISEFYKILDEFKNDGFSNSGKIKLVGLKRVIVFILTPNPRTESSIMLKYNSEV